MQCPFDATTLQVVTRSGVDIDWCPTCKGVWLERGELDKLIDQAGSLMSAPQPAQVAAPSRILPAQPLQRRDRDDDDDDWDDRRRVGADGYPRKKRKNMLSEIFDF